MNGLHHAAVEANQLPRMESNEKADFYGTAPDKCPACGGGLKDYNAESAVTPPGVSVSTVRALMVHLYICEWCRLKVFAPPRNLAER